MSLDTMLESVGTLKRPVMGRDSAGGQTQDQKVVLTDIPCSVQEASGSTVTRFAQRQTQVDTTIYMEEDIGARENDILEVEDDDGRVATFSIPAQIHQLFNRDQAPFAIHCTELK